MPIFSYFRILLSSTVDRFEVIDSSNDSICSTIHWFIQCVDLLCWQVGTRIELISDIFSNEHAITVLTTIENVQIKCQVISTFKVHKWKTLFDWYIYTEIPLNFKIFTFFSDLILWVRILYLSLYCHRFSVVFAPNLIMFAQISVFLNQHAAIQTHIDVCLIWSRDEPKLAEHKQKQIVFQCLMWHYKRLNYSQSGRTDQALSKDCRDPNGNPLSNIKPLLASVFFYFPCYVCFHNHLPSATNTAAFC